ncbi:MAG: GNAT family N-acetyltransferase, partial [Flavobacteriia bacterium]|nr:GNAT family N-acetyltransferase [Flavobacteriia bacterium]
ELNTIAHLVYETDPIMSFLFGKNPKAIKQIVELIQQEENAFSYQHIHVYLDGDSIKGLILSYRPSSIDKKRENQVYSEVFSTLQLLILWLKSILLNPILNKKEIDGIYIQNISVSAAARGEGIGSKLLNALENDAKQKNINALWLDVALDNPNAKRLYERMGFETVSKHFILFSKEGFYRMKKIVNI